MTDIYKAAEQALEALEKFETFRRIMTDGPDTSDKVLAEDYAEMAFVQGHTAITALRAALAQKQREHDLRDVRCECCGYMTYHREHMGCIRAAAPQPAVQDLNSIKLGGCPFCGKSSCVAGQCRTTPQPAVQDDERMDGAVRVQIKRDGRWLNVPAYDDLVDDIYKHGVRAACAKFKELDGATYADEVLRLFGADQK